MNGYSISKATLGRLPKYLQYLKDLPAVNGATISATAIAKGLCLGDVQVRKDLAAVSGAGKPKIGYERAVLISDIERHLGCKSLTNAVLVGAGKLGSALLDYDGFEEFGVRIVAAFDCNEKVIRFGKSSKVIFPISDIGAYCAENDVKLGIITVGQGSAQEVCNKLVECGIQAIWNFAPCTLDVPSTVLVRQEKLALSLAHLNSQIKSN